MATRRILINHSCILVFGSCLFVLGGCVVDDEPMPEIVGVSPTVYIPERRPPVPPARPSVSGVPQAWLPPSSVEKRWTAIIIHHSATAKGNAAIFDKSHKNNGWDGVGYDFVIGNGNGSGNGQVQPTFRWRQQKTGAHCKTDYTNWANIDSIGICLVGDYNKTFPSSSQMSSLIKLVRFLSNRYSIPKSRIYGHNTTPRHSTVTDCPGKNFSMTKFKSML